MNEISCPVCGIGLRLSLARSRKAKKPKTFLMLLCPVDGKHFRAFIKDSDFVSRALEGAEDLGKKIDQAEG